MTESQFAAPKVHGWIVGRDAIMPDHLHFFTAPQADAKSLSAFMRDWKKWSTRPLIDDLGLSLPVWQAELFNHILRSAGSYEEKCNYVRENPVRAGLCASAEAWPYAGEFASLVL